MYEEYHADVWPEVLEDNRRGGIRRNYIFRSGTRLFMFCEADDSVDPAALESLASSTRSNAWQELMNTMFEPTSEGAAGVGWTQMKEIATFENATE
jgi:L-rhamnose mutarotase